MKSTLAKKSGYVAIIAVMVSLVLLPCLASSYILSFMIITLMFIIMASSWNLFCGFTGYVSLGHGLFFGAGGYAFALAMVKGQWPYYYSIALAALVAGGLAFAMALLLLTVRIKIAYFALITLGFTKAGKSWKNYR